MKILRSSIFRALCAVIIGILLIQYPEKATELMIRAIGALFLVSGVISCATYYSATRQQDDIQVYDAEGRLVVGGKPSFPIVGIGSLILGVILAAMPHAFISGLTYLLGAIVILGAITQFVNLAAARKYADIGAFFWIMPSLLLIVGIVAIAKPDAVASAPFLLIGWCLVAYGVFECLCSIKINIARNQMQKAARTHAEANAKASQAEDAQVVIDATEEE
jgi:uncharacterized membrane protein HdeD (DUF308 family)